MRPDQNGLASLTPELKINGPLNIRHFQTLAELQKDGTFQYGGRTSEAKSKFLNGECAIMPESSGGLGDMVKAGMDFGTGSLPYYPEAAGRSAEHRPRRRIALGLRRQTGRRLQGRRPVLHLPVEDRRSGPPASGFRLSPGHHGGL